MSWSSPRHVSLDRQGPLRCLIEAEDNVVGRAAQFVFIGTVVAIPWLLEPFRTAAWVVGFLGVAIALVCNLISAWISRRSIYVPAVCFPLIAGVALGAVQLAKLDSPTAEMLGSSSHALWSRAAPTADPHDSHEGASSADAEAQQKASAARRFPISLYPAGTRRDMEMLALAIAALIVAADLFQRAGAARLLLGAIAINGLALAFMGISDRIAADHGTFWADRFPTLVASFGVFLNRNQAGGYLNMCLAAAVGCLIFSIARTSARPVDDYDAYGSSAAQDRRTLVEVAAAWLANLTAWHMLWATAVIVLVTGVSATLSRGAALALVAGAVLTGLALLRRATTAAVVVSAPLVIGVGALVVLLGLGDRIGVRLETLLDEHTFEIEPRLAHWNEAVHVFGDNWLIGSGLGAYRYAYLRFQQRMVEGVFSHAENQYLEAAIVGGVVGLGLLLSALACMAIVVRRLAIAFRRGGNAAFLAVAVFALATQMAQACVDFGLYSPANLLLFATLCGCLSSAARTAIASTRHAADEDDAIEAGRVPAAPAAWFDLTRIGTTALAGTLAVALAAVAHDVAAASMFEEMGRLTTVAEKRSQDTQAWVAGQLDRVRAALTWRPDDVEGRLLAARLETKLHTLEAREQLRGVLGGQRKNEELDDMVRPLALEIRAWEVSRTGGAKAVDQLRELPSVAAHLPSAARHLLAARLASPLEPRSHARLAELSFLSGSMADDEAHLARLAWLAPSDVDAAFNASLIHLAADRWDEAFERWRRCMALSRRYDERILSLAKLRMGAAELVEKVLPAEPEVVVRAADRLYPKDSANWQRRILVGRIDELAGGEDEPERSYLLGWVARERDDHAAAAEHWLRAVEAPGAPVEWHYELALELESLGRFQEAYEHVQRCVRHEPDDPVYLAAAKRLVPKVRASR